MTRVLGIDGSLLASGLVLLPAGWFTLPAGPDWSGVAFEVVGEELPADASPLEQARRVRRLVSRISAFASAQDVTHVALEDYSFSRGNARARMVAEFIGRLKDEILIELGLPLSLAKANQWRKLMLGAEPHGETKDPVRSYWARLGAPWGGLTKAKREALADAAGVANWGLAELGFQFVGTGEVAA